MLSSTLALAQTTDDNESTSKSLIRCHHILFALAVFSKLPITNDENALIERIRSTIPRIATDKEILRISEIVATEYQTLIAEMTSGNLSASSVQVKKNEFFNACTPVLSSAEALPNVR